MGGRPMRCCQAMDALNMLHSAFHRGPDGDAGEALDSLVDLITAMPPGIGGPLARQFLADAAPFARDLASNPAAGSAAVREAVALATNACAALKRVGQL